ncbi:hypothetical protein [Streptomyces mirabilis]|uniref:hypothetical protein n=1 Tax=Streptomyces mirabilis TaxID=68239 RepID=UPI0036AA74A5
MSWPTRAGPQPNFSRRPAATDDFPEALVPRRITSRVSSLPTITAATLPTASDTAWGVSLKPDRHTSRQRRAGLFRAGRAAVSYT